VRQAARADQRRGGHDQRRPCDSIAFHALFFSFGTQIQ
jgi:hypothetical protein